MNDFTRNRSRTFLVVGWVAGAMLAGCSNDPPVGPGPASTGSPPSVATAPPPTIEPSPSPILDEISGRIVFGRAGGSYGDETVFVANADGTDERRVTDVELGGPFRVSPDGRWLIANGGGPETEPYTGAIVNLADGTLERLPTPDPTLNLAPLAWSADGVWIAFEGWDDADPDRNGLYKARFPSGADLQQLTASPDAGLDSPADWSADDEIVFYRHESGPSWDQGGSLWIVHADGTGLRPLTTPGVEPSWWVRWSSAGDRLLFASARLQSPGAIWAIGADGSDLTKVFEDVEGRYPVTPTWSDDDSLIMFSLDPVADEWTHPINQVFLIRADGSGLTALIDTKDHKREFEWFDAPAADEASIIGTWYRTQTCEEVLAAFKAAGFAETQLGWLAGFFEDEKVPTAGDICGTAIGPLEHSHFFTAAGAFGSHDQNGQQVDDGDYAVPGPGGLTFPTHAAEFGYDGEIAVFYTVAGDVVTFDVSVPKYCSGSCASAYAWALSAFASGPWLRGEAP